MLSVFGEDQLTLLCASHRRRLPYTRFIMALRHGFVSSNVYQKLAKEAHLEHDEPDVEKSLQEPESV
jgi:hypothetical protein